MLPHQRCFSVLTVVNDSYDSQEDASVGLIWEDAVSPVSAECMEITRVSSILPRPGPYHQDGPNKYLLMRLLIKSESHINLCKAKSIFRILFTFYIYFAALF